MNIIECLLELCPGAEWELTGIDYENLIWHDKKYNKPTKQEIEHKWHEICNQRAMVEYREQRKEKYPTIGDQLDALFHAGVFPEEMAAQIQAVKDEYPKPEELNG